MSPRFVGMFAALGILAVAGLSPEVRAQTPTVSVNGDQRLGPGETEIETSGEAIRIDADDDDASVEIFSATVTTTDGSGDAVVVLDGADRVTITVGGSDADQPGTIATQGRGARGIVSDGDFTDIDIDAFGRIETEGRSSTGIESTGADADITVSGAIETAGRSSDGIYSEGANADITVAGVIETEGDNSDGIHSEGANARIRVGGVIETEGGLSDGIHSLGANADITVDGLVTVDDGYGIYFEGIDTDIHIGERGRIEMQDSGSNGIWSYFDAANADITVDGTIETTGDTSNGIVSEADNARIRVGGVIRTMDDFSNGIWSYGNDAEITVSGMIRTAGMTSHGISSEGADADITVTGEIRTAGMNSHGIDAFDGSETITIAGEIRTVGAESHGIAARDGDGTITVSGGIHATGDGAFAISGGGQTLRLRRGWSITGPITLEDGRLELETGGVGISRTLHIPDLAGVEITGDGPLLRPDDDTFAVLDPSASAMQRVMLAHVARAVHGAVHDRDATAQPVAADASAGASFGDRRAWGAVIAGGFRHGDDGAALGWDGRVAGVVGGVEGRLDNGITVGVIGGYARSEAKTGTASIDADAGTGMLGVYGETGGDYDGGTWTVTGALVGGYGDHDTIRLVHDNDAGRQRARGSHNGLFVSPSVGLELAHPVGRDIELRPSGRVDGLFARHGSYAESGAGVSNVAYDSWTGVSATGRAQLGVAAPLWPSAEFEARAGATGRLHSGDDVTARLAGGGNTVTYGVPGDRSVFGGFVGGRITWTLGDRVSLLADAEYGRAGGDERTFAGRVRLSVSF